MIKAPPPRAYRPTFVPTIMLVAVTLLWGLSFPLMKNWLEASRQCPGGIPVAILTLIALRMFLALAVLGVFRPGLFGGLTRRECNIGVLIGAVFFLGYALQVLGLVWTTPAMSAFITSLGSAWVPVLAWLWFRATMPRLTRAGLGLGVAGTVMLGLADVKEGSWGQGELVTAVASLVFAVEILLLDRLGRTVRPERLTVPFFAAAAFLALPCAAVFAWSKGHVADWLTWTAAMLEDGAVLRDIALLTLLSTVLAFYWMNVYQPRITAWRAALIYLLEPVFGTAFSIAWGHDSLTLRLVAGGGLILMGNAVVELPGWLGVFDKDEADRDY